MIYHSLRTDIGFVIVTPIAVSHVKQYIIALLF